MDSVNFSEYFSKFHKHKGLVGISPMLHDIKDDCWILRPKVKENLKIIVDEDFPINILIFPRHLPYIIKLLKEFPTLRAVIDHIAKPNITNGELDPRHSQIRQVANFSNVMCKLSGMITEADHENWLEENLKSYISHVLNVFGIDSVMLGSDCLFCLIAGTYNQVYNALLNNLPGDLLKEELDSILVIVRLSSISSIVNKFLNTWGVVGNKVIIPVVIILCIRK